MTALLILLILIVPAVAAITYLRHRDPKRALVEGMTVSFIGGGVIVDHWLAGETVWAGVAGAVVGLVAAKLVRQRLLPPRSAA